MPNMEITVGDYGRMMFEAMTSKKSDIKHWDSIRDEAKSLVNQLLALNEKMEGGGYKIIGTVNGKKNLSDYERIELAQQKMWTVKAKTLKDGDYIWCGDGDGSMMTPGTDGPAKVVEVTKKNVYVEIRGCNFEFITQIGLDEEVIKAPKDFFDKEEQYESDEWWLEQADRLGI